MLDERTFKVQINGEWVDTQFEDIKPGDIFTHCETLKIYKAISAAVDGRIDADEVKVCRK